MSKHDKIRELLALAAADALTNAEEKQVAEHVRSCIACSNELEAWRPIASELRRLPTPQPSSWLVQATLARAEAKLAEQVEPVAPRRRSDAPQLHDACAVDEHVDRRGLRHLGPARVEVRGAR